MGAAASSDPNPLCRAVQRAFSHIAERPGDEHPFKVGRALAEAAGYPPDVLDRMPGPAVEAFAGVSCLPCFAHIEPGAHVLDLGSGSGLDSLLLATTGCSVVGVDFSAPMRERARAAARQTAVVNVEFRSGDAQAIPARDAEFDAAVANGIFNLNPGRERIFAELARVVRPGGQAFVAELILKGPLPEGERGNERNWFA